MNNDKSLIAKLPTENSILIALDFYLHYFKNEVKKDRKNISGAQFYRARRIENLKHRIENSNFILNLSNDDLESLVYCINVIKYFDNEDEKAKKDLVTLTKMFEKMFLDTTEDKSSAKVIIDDIHKQYQNREVNADK